ncbi:peptide deformylase [Patescibacteria group bacterium]|nr:peptide deformylase [Patescibacteria group bacterium]
MGIIQKNEKDLRQTTKEVPLEEIKSKKIKNIITLMKKALSQSKDGVALAAPQIGESVRIFIINLAVSPPLGGETAKPSVFINPVIKKISKKKLVVHEGCLSVEGIYGTIKRAEKLTIEAYDENGKKFFRGVSGLLSQIIQHEMDHLNGILFIDKAIRLEKYAKQ